MVDIKVFRVTFMVMILLALTGNASNCAPLAPAGQTITIRQGQSATLHAASVNGVAFQWLKNGTNIGGAILNSLIVSTPGTYQVQSVNNQDCSSDISDPVTVIVSDEPTAVADMMVVLTVMPSNVQVDNPFNYTIMVKNNGPATATGINVNDPLPAELQFLQLTTPKVGAANYNSFSKSILWTIDQMATGNSATLNFMAKASKNGTIGNTATVSAQTTDPDLTNNTSTAMVNVSGLVIPNVFTPNGDGINETFEIPGLENYAANELTVMNRWGATVYQMKGYKNDWSGSGLNEGTYFYLLRVQNADGKWTSYKGYVTLLRSKP